MSDTEGQRAPSLLERFREWVEQKAASRRGEGKPEWDRQHPKAKDYRAKKKVRRVIARASRQRNRR